MRTFSLTALVLGLLAAPAAAQDPDGAAVFTRACAACHSDTPADGRTPSVTSLRERSPDTIITALTTGVMRLQGEGLSEAERRAVASFLGRPASPAVGAIPECTTVPLVSDPGVGAFWNGWGAGIRNTRFQPADRARLAAADVPRLELKWALGFPGAAASGRSQATVAGGRLLVGTGSGDVHSLDPLTGCAHWTFRAQAGVRAAITVATYSGEGSTGPYAAYIADTRANVYAVDVLTGKLLWTRRVDDHPAAGITGGPTFYAGRLYVPVAGLGEEMQAANLKYECCTFRGSVAALDAASGNVLWKTYTIADVPAPRAKNSAGTQLHGPSGGGIWNAPTIDTTRRVLYVGTGNGYSDPPQPHTDAILALELQTGAIRWAHQTTKGDVWVLGCPKPGGNCPEQNGPDFDFGSSPILATVPGGRELIIAAQKSGIAYALDPDKQGAVVWQYRAGKGGLSGGIQWGPAVDAEHVYLAVSDAMTPKEAGGLHAVRLATGERAWYAPPAPPACGAVQGCHAAQSGAVTVMPGVVFSGSSDGVMRAYDTATGKVVWEVNTNREFETVNGVKGSGGSIDGPGPVVVNGMLYFHSGYQYGRPGNVLLAFGLPDAR